ncbi:hypothetical protein KDU71_10730 [Carboxylicivirga sediminis]|uniref:Uncharacterized protein n=1 Tax=Carboxylicivirga sediminis TaxID=2006564 RepID=A0A941F428_9BACT|nr:hypothetical protein [Carboxylicivirga sediminis]MBR8536034.1 hypothetical protein [Carboxylicivirga sediminis]
MQNIEPFSRWETVYLTNQDPQSIYYGDVIDEYLCRNTIYNHYIHPKWDEFGSKTLYLKILFVSYEQNFAIIELMGEWNDCLYNDIMHLKRTVVEHLADKGISKFILIGENVLNFHYSDDAYYEDWFNDIEDGWIMAVNFRQHVLEEFDKINLNYYILYGGQLNSVKWRTLSPLKLFAALDHYANSALNP